MPTDSRLLTSTEEYRNYLKSRNLYTSNVEYPLSNKSLVDKTLGIISSIIGGITPFKSINLEDSVLGRVNNIANQTPLSMIGLAMLGKQMTLNEMSHISQRTFPTINFNNLLDKDPKTSLFTLNKDMRITVDKNGSGFKNFLEKISFYYPNNDYPFDKESNNDSYLDNTGTGQLNFLYNSINLNRYKSNDVNFLKKSEKIKNPIQPRSNLVTKDTKFFSFDLSTWYPYTKNATNISNYVNKANESMMKAYNNVVRDDYAFNSEVIDGFGKTYKLDINKNDESNSNNIVWGRDGVVTNVNKSIIHARGNFNKKEINIDDDGSDFSSNFKVSQGGLLEYTRNLVTATEGRIGDITRKAFNRDDNGFKDLNGSGLWKSNNSKYAKQSGFNDFTGVRQHTALDQYDRFAKAIRFEGNYVYNGESRGNVDSVIYKSVMPRIHPSFDEDGKLVNKNLMFSIENLAVRVISSNGYDGGGVGIMDDEFGSEIPATEVGPFNGRMMWFPPYGIEINETASAKYESTVMVGRNEPMYNYMNSERTATISFMLLIDYPPQVDNYRKSETGQKDLADFFAFGGEPTPNTPNIKDIELLIKKLEDKKKSITGGEKIPPDIKLPDAKYIYYPNDIPKINGTNSNLTTVIDDMYKGGYQVNSQVTPDKFDGSIGNLNCEIYCISRDDLINTTGNSYIMSSNPSSQYTSINTTNTFDNSDSGLNKALFELFNTKENINYVEINITGSASALYQNSEYNKLLSQRRIDVAKNLIISKLSAMFGSDYAKNIKITFKENAKGQSEANKVGVNSETINYSIVIQDRYAKIEFKRTSCVPETVNILTSDENNIVNDLNKQIENLKTQLDNEKNLVNDSSNLGSNGVMNERSRTKGDAIQHGFKSIIDNYYYPVFHSQTPEDFHKRLTFLQQCTRQGSSTHYSTVGTGDKLTSKNSVFGRQPICILRIGDFFYTKIIIETVNFDYINSTWDMNPEGFGMQPMLAKISMNVKVIGGQSLKGPIDALQNAVSYNYYANSNFTDKGRYKLPSDVADKQWTYTKGILTKEQVDLLKSYTVYKNSKKT